MVADQPQNQPQALPDLAAWLVYQHQQAQQQLATTTAYGLAALWPILQFMRLDETTSTWLHAVTLQVEASFRESEKLAYEMVQGVRWAWLPDAPPLALVENTFPRTDVQTSLRVTGPVSVKRALPAPPDDAMARGKVNSAGAGVKHALNGGRAEVLQLVARDKAPRKDRRTVLGWARVTDGNPCHFCALLASQGAVYLNDGSFDQSNSKVRDIKNSNGDVVARRAFADGKKPSVVKVHDHCQCSLRPVYSVSDKWDARAKNFLEQWNNLDATGLDYKEQVKEFRKFYVPPSPYEVAPPVNLDAVRANREALKSGLGASSPQVAYYDRIITKLA